MKKIIALITGLVLLSSIIIVSFFGTLAYTKEKNIYCDYVALTMIDIKDDDKTAVKVLEREEDSKVHPEDWWDNDYNYRINVYGTKYLENKLDNTFKLHCEAKTLRPGKLVSDPKLNYYVSEPVDWNTYINETDLNNDKIHVIKYHESNVIPFTIKVQSNDPKGKFIKIRLQINKKGAESI